MPFPGVVMIDVLFNAAVSGAVMPERLSGVVVIDVLFNIPVSGAMVLETVPRTVLERFAIMPPAPLPAPMLAVVAAVPVVFFVARAAMVVPSGPGEI